MRGQNRDLLLHMKQNIPIPLFVKTRGLLRLDLVHYNLILGGALEILQIGRARSPMLLGEVAFCCLDGGGELDLVDVSRLDLRLHQKMGHAIKFLADDP